MVDEVKIEEFNNAMETIRDIIKSDRMLGDLADSFHLFEIQCDRVKPFFKNILSKSEQNLQTSCNKENNMKLVSYEEYSKLADRILGLKYYLEENEPELDSEAYENETEKDVDFNHHECVKQILELIERRNNMKNIKAILKTNGIDNNDIECILFNNNKYMKLLNDVIELQRRIEEEIETDKIFDYEEFLEIFNEATEQLGRMEEIKEKLIDYSTECIRMKSFDDLSNMLCEIKRELVFLDDSVAGIYNHEIIECYKHGKIVPREGYIKLLRVLDEFDGTINNYKWLNHNTRLF